MTEQNQQQNVPNLGSSGIGLDPSELLRAIVRKKWLILAAAVAVGAAVAAGTMRQNKIYEGRAEVMIDPVLPKILGDAASFDAVTELAMAERAFYNTQFEIIKSKMILRRAVDALDIPSDASFVRAYDLADRSKADLPDAIVQVIYDQMQVKPHFDSRIVSISVEDLDAQRAARLANAIAQAYMDYTLERRLTTTRGASSWLDKRVVEFGNKLESDEKALYDFRKDNTLVSVSLEDRLNQTSGKLTTLNDELSKIENQEIELKAKKSVIERESQVRNGNLEAIPRVASSEAIEHFKTVLTDLRKERADLSSRYGPLHQSMVAINREIEEVAKQMQNEIENVVRSIDNEMLTLQEMKRATKQAIAEEKERAFELNELTLSYNKLSRELGTTKTIYEALLKRHAEADLSGMLESNYVHWFEPAEANLAPVRPSVPKNTGIGLAVGLVLGFVVVIAGVLLDNTIHTHADIEETVGATFLGVLPSINREVSRRPGQPAKVETNARDLFIMNNPSSSVAECARSIRTNLLFMGANKPLKRILLTSPNPMEGKSTIAVNLATVMAQAGNRVLLVDTDLRRPRLHRTFGVSSEQGLTNLLLQDATIEDVTKKTEVSGLDLLPCGPLPPNPAELIHSERFTRLLEELDRRYDLVVLDSPPTNAVTDAVILAQMVSGVLMVLKASKTTKEAARRAKRNLTGVNANLLGCILNDIDLTSDGYGEYQYYYRRYYRRENAEA